MRGEYVELSKEELNRLLVIQKHIEGLITINEAAKILDLSSRQVKRLKKGVLELGPQSLAHGNRGRVPKHAIPEDVKDQVIMLASSRYQGFNFHHIRDLLSFEYDINLSVSSVRRILTSAGIKSPKKKRRPKSHLSRPRRARMGELVQIDASPFCWLGPDKPCVALLAAIDDATGQVLAAVFRPSEDQIGYLMLIYQIVTTYGVPLMVYSDRHTIFLSPKAEKLSIEEELAGLSAPLTNFGQSLADLGIYHSFARSPQAKGRIERLWETLQDRLSKELSLAGVVSIEDANNFLLDFIPRFNAKFAVAPDNPAPAFRPAPDDQQLLLALSLRHKRKADSGSTICFKNMKYQLVDNDQNIVCLKKGATVTISVDIFGSIRALYNGNVYALAALNHQPPTEAKAVSSSNSGVQKAGCVPPHRPASNHPWKRWNPNFLRSNHNKSLANNSRVTFSQNHYGDIFSER